MATPQAREILLFVDDDPHILESFTAYLGRRYQVRTAPGGSQALELLRELREVDVIVSDFMMPGMTGAAFLAESRTIVPDAMRIVLTGQADLSGAMAAVNDGQIFRFLQKPCPLPMLIKAIEAGIAQRRLVTAERVLLEETLHGSIRALTEALALTQPMAFGRACRLKKDVAALASRLDVPQRWQAEVAAMLSQLGCIILPEETVTRLHYDEALSVDEQRMVMRMPAAVDSLLEPIPRLEGVRAILKGWRRPWDAERAARATPEEAALLRAGQLLLAADDYDGLLSTARTPARAIAALRERAERYDPQVLEALIDLKLTAAPGAEAEEVLMGELMVGMVFAEDVVTPHGTVLVARGFEVTPSFLEKVRNFKAGAIREPMRIVARGEG